MTKFAFIIHPLKAKDAAKKYKVLRYLPDGALEALMGRMKPLVASEVKGVTSITGAKTEGIFIGLPMTPHMFMTRPLEETYDRLAACCDLAFREGAQIIGLGAFTSVVGDGGLTVAKRANIAVTTGNSYTVATAIEGALDAARRVGVKFEESTLAVVGATGSIGKTCAMVMGPMFAKTLVVGRDLARTQAVAAQLPRAEGRVDVECLREADVVVTVTSSESDLIFPEHLKVGAVVCDVARPRDVSVRVVKERQDVLVIEGGVVRVPGTPDFGIDFGFPKGTAYACMCETMMLALDDRPESLTLGKDVTVEQVETTRQLAAKHGFTLEGYRSFERAVNEESIDRVRVFREQARLTPVR